MEKKADDLKETFYPLRRISSERLNTIYGYAVVVNTINGNETRVVLAIYGKVLLAFRTIYESVLLFLENKKDDRQ